MESALEILRRFWGYDAFRPLQEEAIQAVLENRESLVVLPTGAGKSLCFQVPALCRPGMAVVVSPLISLMKDQVDGLLANGIGAAYVNSSQSLVEQREIAVQIRNGRIKLLYLAPERLLTERMLGFLKTVQVSFIAIDEAHCISDWGHDFRPEYRGLSGLREHFPSIRIHGYTATASERVRQDIVQQMKMPNPSVLVGSFDRPNLVYRAIRARQRVEQIMEVVERHRGESGIVYCISRKEVERVAYLLRSRGYRVAHYHAGLMDKQRRDNQEQFQRGEIDIIVATVAFGMGIDKPDVRFVVHGAMPKSIEHYQQESGRAGRDGLSSECVLIYSPADLVVWKRMLENEPHSKTSGADAALESMLKFCSTSQCRHRFLSRHFGQDLERDRCQACDNCQSERVWHPESLTIAQKILSGVMRLDQRYGADYTSRVLQGLKDARFVQRKHDQLSTFGVLKEESLGTIRRWIDQLVDQEYLVRDAAFQVLKVTEDGKRLLRGELIPKLEASDFGDSSSPSTEFNRSKSGERVWQGVDQVLFERLKAWCSQKATEREVATYSILVDLTLKEIAAVRPSTMERMSGVRGMGEQKLREFGQPLLELIRKHCEESGQAFDVEWKAPQREGSSSSINPMQMEANKLFAQGMSCEQVSRELSRALSTTHGYLNEYLRAHQITDASRWVPAEVIERVEAAKAQVDTMGPLRYIYEPF